METLGKKQVRFSSMIPGLIAKALELYGDVRLGDLFRDPRLHGAMGVKLGYGHKNSCHKLKLAIDLNRVKDGILMGATSDHKELGEWWEAQGKDHCWGGRFGDGNHYSISHNGYK